MYICVEKIRIEIHALPQIKVIKRAKICSLACGAVFFAGSALVKIARTDIYVRLPEFVPVKDICVVVVARACGSVGVAC